MPNQASTVIASKSCQRRRCRAVGYNQKKEIKKRNLRGKEYKESEIKEW